MLTKNQIKDRFDCEPFDAGELDKLQRAGFRHGKAGRWADKRFEEREDWQDEVGIDVEHVAALALLDEADVLKLYEDAHAEGLKARGKATRRAA